MAKRNLGEKIKLSTYDEMFGTDTFGHDDQKCAWTKIGF